jgi:antitoxin (DNA-binding transcriptional repressor) of toxin-antitoxin stability system
MWWRGFWKDRFRSIPVSLNRAMILVMATIHIAEAEAARDFAAVMAHIRAGVEVVIETETDPIAVFKPLAPERRTIEECMALLPEESSATIDEDFARDIEAAVAAHREPLNASTWD